MADAAAYFIDKFVETAESIKHETERSKKYRAGVATLAQMAVNSNNTAYLEAAIRFSDKIIDGHDRSRGYVDIVRGMARVARNLSDPQLVQRALELSERTKAGHDRSHALQGVAAAMAEVGAMNQETSIEDAKVLAQTIEYDTYRSSALRSISRTQHDNADPAALDPAMEALEIIDTSNTIAHPIYRASAYSDLSLLFLDLGQIDTARQCIWKSCEVADTLENEFQISSIYQSIAQTQLRIGARTMDRTFLEMAVASYAKITREYYRTSARQTIRTVLQNLGETELLEIVA